MKQYFTFGSGQPFEGHYVMFEYTELYPHIDRDTVDCRADAREKMSRYFGACWCGQYDEPPGERALMFIGVYELGAMGECDFNIIRS